ncbi:exodeoxyribonuclease V subunit beta [Sphingomonas sp. LHG3406-1]|uniref:UvrD-helicase domain-containing protein n=1 Tax=Sphingomonas sp. LHG3406-1 TaxID=2804617 RepID=UPI002628920F|nr:UvrD-helicase domain-containing protein [Sphingomonas sp. LHG3406-1]
MGGSNIRTVVASAGTGKTYRIVSDIAQEVENRPPEGIVATTFTVKAADELIERARAKLFETGKADKAARLLGARFGTLNAICGQIVAEHAIALGRSPRVEVIPEDSSKQIFAVAADAAIERHAPVLNELAEAMGFFEPKQAHERDSSDWRVIVQRIIELARSNGIGADGLRRSSEKSIASFLEVLPQPAPDGDRLDQDLAAAVSAAAAAIPADFSATAKPAVKLLRQIDAANRRGERLCWPDWARLSKLKCAKKDGPAFVAALEDVCRAASRHPEHPRLREGCKRFITELFSCAAQALSAFQAYKAERGLLDFTDQEALALEALKNPVTAARLSERIGRLFVDEFQDSSPLQIAIFTALAPLVDASTWVGDPKQAIYGFRNADSLLTQAAFAGVAAQTSKPQDVLSRSYRSREGIIDFVNAAFAPALDAMGLAPEEHAFSGTARQEDGFTSDPLSVWWLEGSLEKQYAALAEAVRDAVSAVSQWNVGTKSKDVRPMRPGDVAILCRTKDDITKVAGALSSVGVRVAVEREGLTRTPHVELVIAAYRWVTDPTDTLALAELARFLADDPESEAWLEALGGEDQRAALRAVVPITPHLEQLREQVLGLTPGELVDAIALLPDVIRRIESWGDVAARLDDLEALRGFARSYEANCSNAGVPATSSGLLLALSAQKPKRPPSLREDAVKVMTYHGAKGLEWPCVILTGLAKQPRARLFAPVAQADGEIDWKNPLEGRWIRFWPWPYGSQGKDVYLDTSAANSPIGQQALTRARDEEVRLLYVGVTRARDHLVFAPAVKTPPNWISVLDSNGVTHVDLPQGCEGSITAGKQKFTAAIAVLSAAETAVARTISPAFVRGNRETLERPPLHRRPSGAASGLSYQVVERIQLGGRLPLVGEADMRLLGEAVHAIIASDDLLASHADRLSLAQRVLANWGVHQIAAPDVLAAHDRLAAELRNRWPTGRVHRETPVSAHIGDQLVNGRIDLLVEHDVGFAIIDHKSFPGSRDQWDTRAAGYGPQLGLYAEALEKAWPGSHSELYVHMPLVGALLRVKPTEFPS